MRTGLAKPFLFIHIRKTAGSSLRGLLANAFPANRVLFNAHSVRGPQEPGDAIFATGHVGFSYAQRFAIPPTIFTTIREPVSRCFSAYYFFRNNDEHFFRALATELDDAEYESRRRFTDRARHLDMLRLLVEEESLARAWLSNAQTRQLVGGSYAGLADDDPRVLETALAHLAECDLVGITERLDDTLRLLEHIMNWGRLGPLLRLNSTIRRETADVDPRCFEILRSWNLLDLRLYEEAYRLFEMKLKAVDNKIMDNTSPDTVWLSDGEEFTPDMPIRGYGWHERECHQGRWLCWNSAATATLDVGCSKSRFSKFRCLLSHVICQSALDSLQISMNSVPLTLQKRGTEDGILLEGAIPKKARRASQHLARITFDCPVMQRPCDIDPNSTDSRSMGVAVARLQID
jgi:Galactose-3-O-sulfotransferase